MAPNFFYAYLGVFFAGSVVLAVLVKKLASGFAASGKKPFVYGAFSSAVASGASYGVTLISNNLFTVYWILAGIYLLFGIIHMLMVHKKYFSADQKNQTKVIIGEIIFGLSIIFFTVVVFSALQYFVSKETGFIFYPLLMSTITFFIPFLYMKTFDAAYKIPAAVYKTWQYPLNETIEIPDEKFGEKILVIGFEISKDAKGQRSYFRAKAPEGMTLGELYYHFINDYNEAQSETPITFSDNGYEPHTWWFRRKPKWYQRERILDPGVTMRENKVKENTVIICERLSNHFQS